MFSRLQRQRHPQVEHVGHEHLIGQQQHLPHLHRQLLQSGQQPLQSGQQPPRSGQQLELQLEGQKHKHGFKHAEIGQLGGLMAHTHFGNEHEQQSGKEQQQCGILSEHPSQQ